jgi:CheY-like chemotaxis protein
MANITLPTILLADTVLVIDDEPEHIQWLLDFIQSRGLKTQIATTVKEAIDFVEKYQFRGYIVDLNIPMGGWAPVFASPGPVYDKYMGFYVIKYVRTQGNKGRNVMAYSAHSNEQIISETDNLYCESTTKGRAKDLKDSINALLSFPLDAGSVLGSIITRP